MQEDDDNQNLVLGILFGIIALVVGLVIGLSVYVTGQNRAPAPVAAVVAEEPEIAEVGEPLVKFYFESGKAELPAGAPDELAKVIAKLNEDPSKLVLLSGYHDETGGAAVNAEVAKARAGASLRPRCARVLQMAVYATSGACGSACWPHSSVSAQPPCARMYSVVPTP